MSRYEGKALDRLPGTRQSGVSRRRNGAVVPSACLEADEVLCIIHNATTERFSISMLSTKPCGQSFLVSQDVMLEVGGFCSFVASAEQETVVRVPFAAFTLDISNGRPLFIPTDGTRQHTKHSGSTAEPTWVLYCALTSTSQQTISHCVPDTVFRTVHEFLSSLPNCSIFSSAWQSQTPRLPDECTIVVLEDSLLDESGLEDTIVAQGLDHFVIAEAVFVRAESYGEAVTADSTRITFTGQNTQVLVQIEATDVWPVVRCVGERKPCRLANLWCVCYAMRRIL